MHTSGMDGWMDVIVPSGTLCDTVTQTVSLCFDAGQHVGRRGACVRACLRGSVGRLIIIREGGRERARGRDREREGEGEGEREREREGGRER